MMPAAPLPLCGVDLIEVPRVRLAIERHGERFLQRVFHPEEIAYCRRKTHPWPNWSVRFAAKEALFKAVRPGTLRHLVWREIYVTRHRSGQPQLAFAGDTETRLQGWRFSLALSHLKDLAIAQVIALPPDAPESRTPGA
jgi:holo-[acyl-carrier protein] synthase